MKSMMLAGFAWTMAAAAQAAAPNAQDEAALRALAATADAAWDAKDAERMASCYTGDATLLLGAGEPQRGRANVQAYFQRTFGQRPGVMRHVSEFRDLDIVSPDLALSDLWVRVEERQPDGGWKEVRRFHNVSLAQREPDGWKLRVVRAYPVTLGGRP